MSYAVTYPVTDVMLAICFHDTEYISVYEQVIDTSHKSNFFPFFKTMLGCHHHSFKLRFPICVFSFRKSRDVLLEKQLGLGELSQCFASLTVRHTTYKHCFALTCIVTKTVKIRNVVVYFFVHEASKSVQSVLHYLSAPEYEPLVLIALTRGLHIE